MDPPNQLSANAWAITSLLLSLLPPSCMVAPIRELANTLLSTSFTTSQPLPMHYGLKPLELDNRTTLVLSNTRELDRDPFTN